MQIGRQVVGRLKDPSDEVPKLTFHGSFTHPQTMLREDDVFTDVYLSIGGGVSLVSPITDS